MRYAIPLPRDIHHSFPCLSAIFYEGPEIDEFILIRSGMQQCVTRAECEDAALFNKEFGVMAMAKYLLSQSCAHNKATKNQPRRNTLLIMMEEQK